MKDAISSKTKILNLRKIEKDTISNQIWNNIQSNPIDLNNTASWIKSKFEIVMIQRNINATKGEVYKLKMNWLKKKIFILFPILHDNTFFKNILKSKILFKIK